MDMDNSVVIGRRYIRGINGNGKNTIKYFKKPNEEKSSHTNQKGKRKQKEIRTSLKASQSNRGRQT